MSDVEKKKTTGVVKLSDKLIELNSPKALGEFADTLKTFIVENELHTPIGDKNYINIEGWQFAGASIGIFPQVKSVEKIEEEGEVKFTIKGVQYTNPVFKYKAVVELVRASDGTVVGSGVAVCSNKESKKKTFDEYAIASMAQTRAVGKAFRLMLGWIFKLAGYESTPAEEMDETPAEAETDGAQMPISDVKTLVELKLSNMSAVQKTKFVRETIGTVGKKFDDKQYRRLYEAMVELENSEPA